MTKNDLLLASKNEFKDNIENALIYDCERVNNQSGYSYLIKRGEGRPLSCAIHFNKSYEINNEIGKYEIIQLSINTNQKIEYENALITYKGFNITIASVGNYNETMKMWHYNGEGTYDLLANQFIVMSKDDIISDLGFNSIDIILKLTNQYSYIPSYFKVISKNKFILVNCENNFNYNLNSQVKRDLQGLRIIKQVDNVKLSFVNFSRSEALAELERIQDLAINSNVEFGILSQLRLSNGEMIQLSSELKALVYKVDFDIFYYLKSFNNDKSDKFIKEVLYNNLRAL